MEMKAVMDGTCHVNSVRLRTCFPPDRKDKTKRSETNKFQISQSARSVCASVLGWSVSHRSYPRSTRVSAHVCVHVCVRVDLDFESSQLSSEIFSELDSPPWSKQERGGGDKNKGIDEFGEKWNSSCARDKKHARVISLFYYYYDHGNKQLLWIQDWRNNPPVTHQRNRIDPLVEDSNPRSLETGFYWDRLSDLSDQLLRPNRLRGEWQEETMKNPRASGLLLLSDTCWLDQCHKQ